MIDESISRFEDFQQCDNRTEDPGWQFPIVRISNVPFLNGTLPEWLDMLGFQAMSHITCDCRTNRDPIMAQEGHINYNY